MNWLEGGIFERSAPMAEQATMDTTMSKGIFRVVRA
jgi:hypothetical protein